MKNKSLKMLKLICKLLSQIFFISYAYESHFTKVHYIKKNDFLELMSAYFLRE